MFFRYLACYTRLSLFLVSQCVFAGSVPGNSQVFAYFPRFWVAGVADKSQITRFELAILQPLLFHTHTLTYFGLHTIQYDPGWASWVVGAGIGYRHQAKECQQGGYL